VIEDQHNVPQLDPVLRLNPQRQTPRNEKGNQDQMEGDHIFLSRIIFIKIKENFDGNCLQAIKRCHQILFSF
jgi:hypothetical protein